MRDLNVINEILSMRSRMWCRWHVTDKPPQNETRQVDTVGNHPLNMVPRSTAQGEREGGREGRRGGCKSACAQQAGTCM